MRKYDLVKQTMLLEKALATSTLPISKVVSLIGYNAAHVNLNFKEAVIASLEAANDKRVSVEKSQTYRLEEISYAFNLINETEREKSPLIKYIQDFAYQDLTKLSLLSETDITLILEVISYNTRFTLGLGLETSSKKIEEFLHQGGLSTSYSNIIKVANNASNKLNKLLNEALPIARVELETIKNVQDFEVEQDIEKDPLFENLFKDSLPKVTENVEAFVEVGDTIPDTSVDTIDNTVPDTNVDQRSAIAEIEWNESSSDDKFEFVNLSHDHAPVNLNILLAMIRDEIKLEQLNETGGYKVQTTLGRIYLGEGFDSNKILYQNLSDDNELGIDVQAYYESIAPEKVYRLSIKDVLQQVRDRMDLPEEFKVKSIGSGDFAIMKESLGGILNETIVDWYQDGDYEIKDNASKLTSNSFFEKEFNFILTEILEEVKKTSESKDINVVETRESEEKFSAEDNVESDSEVQNSDTKSIDNGNVVPMLEEANQEYYRQEMVNAYSKLYESYMHQQDLKRQGMNVSGAYDTYDIKTNDGDVQFGYNYLGRELGTDDDSKIVFWISTRTDTFSTDPMSTPIRSKVYEVFEQGLDTIKMGNREIRGNTRGDTIPNTTGSVELENQETAEIIEYSEHYLQAIEYFYNISGGSFNQFEKLVEENQATYEEAGIMPIVQGLLKVGRENDRQFVSLIKNSYEMKGVNQRDAFFESYFLENPEIKDYILGHLPDYEAIVTSTVGEIEGISEEARQFISSHPAGHYWVVDASEHSEELFGEPITFELWQKLKEIDETQESSLGYEKTYLIEIQNGKELSRERLDLGSNDEESLSFFEKMSLNLFRETVEYNVNPSPLTPDNSLNEAIIEEFPVVNKDEKSQSISDFEFPENLSDFYPKTPTEKVTANIEAIQLVKELEESGRLITKSEQEILARYVGWGGLANDFFDERKTKFVAQREILKDLVSLKDYQAMVDSSLTAYYTDPNLIRSIYGAIDTLGFKGGRILDPSMGTGNFFTAMPKDLKESSSLFGVELDPITGKIAQYLQPSAEIQISGFETTDFSNHSMDLVITNVPFGNFQISDPNYSSSYAIHDYFIKKSLDLVHEGGLVAVITSTGTMDKKSTLFRKELAEQANLLGAVRLPNNAFKKIAGTEVTSDVLIFQKNSLDLQMTPLNLLINSESGSYRDQRELFNRKRWINTFPYRDNESGEDYLDVPINEYFNQNVNRPYFLGYGQDGESTFKRRTLGENFIKNFNGHTLSVKVPEGELAPLLSERLIEDVEGKYFGTHEETLYKPRYKTINVPEEVVNLNIEKFTHAVVNGSVYYHYSDGLKLKTIDRSFTVKRGQEETTRNKNMLGRFQEAIFDSEINSDENGKKLSTTYFYREAFTRERVNRIEGMLEIKSALQEVMAIQKQKNYTSEQFQAALTMLNQKYDHFENEFGKINDKENRSLLQDDDYYPLLASIENRDENDRGNISYSKGEVFEKPTIRPNESVTEVKSAMEALNVSLNFSNQIDLEFMASLYPRSETEIIKELEGKIIINPQHYLEGAPHFWETREEYYSGDVKTKLEYLKNNQEFLEQSIQAEDFSYSVEEQLLELEKNQPTPLDFNAVKFQIGSKWIPLEIYEGFLEKVFEQNSAKKINLSKESSTYKVDTTYLMWNVTVRQTYGVPGNGRRSYNGIDLFQTLLNMQSPIVRVTDDEGRTHIDEEASAIYRGKAMDLQEAFQTYVREEKAELLLDTYNEIYNRNVPKKYESDWVTVDGLNKNIELRAHQKGAVSRIMSERRALLAHEVGAGKTLSMIASGMKLKEQGLINKPLYVVPSNLTNQFGSELLNYFPDKKVLITTKYDFAKSRRKEFVARIANGAYDAVIIGDSQFQKIPISSERQQEWLERELLEAEIRLGKAENKFTVKEIKSKIKGLEKQLEELTSLERDDLLTFEELGVDFLFVDEAHRYKNMAHDTALVDVVGLNKTTSKRAIDLLLKVRYIQEINNGRGVVFSTGTPISNSVSELYTMMKFLEPDFLEENRLSHFDDFVGNFGTIATELEATVSNTYKQRTRFTKFSNLPELMTIFKNVADVKLSKDLNLDVPEYDDIQVIVEKSETLAEFADSLLDRAEAIESGIVDSKTDNMLKITSESKASSLDLRLLDSEQYAKEVPAKLTALIDNLYKEYKGSEERKGTQMIFSDLGVPHSNRKNPDGSPNPFTVYDEIARLLVEKGIPRQEIAFIQDAKTELQKAKLFEKVRKGEVRFLLASTENGGTGVNVQHKMVAIHHLDIPWKPADLTQRNGRGIRQHNENEHINIYQYSTKGTLDPFMLQTLATKSRFIEQVMRGDTSIREMDDLSEQSTSWTELQAATSDNPYMFELSKTKVELNVLTSQRNNFYATRTENDRLIVHEEKSVERREKQLPLFDEDIQRGVESQGGPFAFEYEGKIIDDRRQAGEFIISTIKNNHQNGGEIVPLGKYRGFDLFYRNQFFGSLFVEDGGINVYLRGSKQYLVQLDLKSELGTLTKINNRINGIEKEKEKFSHSIEESKKAIHDMVALRGQKFPKEEQFLALSEKKKELDTQAAQANEAYKAQRRQRQLERAGLIAPLEVAKSLTSKMGVGFSEKDQESFTQLSPKDQNAIVVQLKQKYAKENEKSPVKEVYELE